jgi:hypothetical protein|tara:strand:- start:1056 stop:1298 length:243 start_codon:yes stop_codon:yes gene_type:complete
MNDEELTYQNPDEKIAELEAQIVRDQELILFLRKRLKSVMLENKLTTEESRNIWSTFLALRIKLNKQDKDIERRGKEGSL